MKAKGKLDSKFGLHHEWVLWTWTLYWNTESLKVLPFRWWIIQWIDDLVQFSHSVMSYSMDCSTPAFPVHHQFQDLAQTHVHWVGDIIQPSHPLSSPPSAFNLSQHQGFSQGVISLHQVAKVLEFQLQHQNFQWIFRTDFLWNELLGSPHRARDSQESSPTPQFKSIHSLALSFLNGPTLTSIHDYWKNHSFE